jgi:uncharacterized membrane protein
MTYLGYILLIIGLIINYKIYYWATISRKGFKSETPEIFLKNPNIYAVVDIIFFIAVIIYSGVSWHFVIILYFVSFIPAGKSANKKYKEVLHELKEKE